MKLFNTVSSVLLVALTSLSGVQSASPGSIPGTTSEYAQIRGHKYHYLLSEPDGTPNGTILLLHGFPDIAYGWRYQVPLLSSLGYRVIAPDLLGYSDTDSPCELENWTRKEMSADMAALLDQVAPGEQVIVGGHDWGAGLTYNFAMWHPELVKALFTAAIPYTTPWLGPVTEWADTADLVANGTYPTFGYQLQWRDQSIDRNFTTASDFRMMFNTLFGGTTPDGQPGFSPEAGIAYDLMPLIDSNPLVDEADMDIYVNSVMIHGSRGIFNWYRTRKMDWEDEQPLANQGPFKFKAPSLFLLATKDEVVLPRYYENMGQHFDDLEIKEIESGHWMLWEARESVNTALESWLSSL